MAWEYVNEAYVYVKPADAIRIYDVSDTQAEWRVEGDLIISDTASLGIKYVYFIDNPAIYPPKFLDAFIDLLCSDICFMITNSAPKAEAFLEKYNKVSRIKAKAENSQVGTHQKVKDDAWENSKYQNLTPEA